MTATDELRAMLDERGVEYVVDEEYGKKYPPEQTVTWSCDIAGEDMTVTARDYFIGDGEYCLDLEFHEVFTPEQAIAATLGAGTCHVKAAKKIGDSFGFSLSCGHSMVNPFNDHPDYCPWCGKKVMDE